MRAPLLYALWAFAAGIGIPIGATMNGGLGRAIGPGAASLVLFTLTLALAAAVITVGGGWSSVPRALAAPPLYLMGGLFIAFYVLSATILIPRFGVGNTILFVLAGQVIASAAIDHFALLGAAHRPLSTRRLLGLGLFLLGLAVAQTGARAGK